jgi:hypothetical protein
MYKNDYEKGFNEAIDQVMIKLTEQVKAYNKIFMESKRRQSKIAFRNRAVGLMDFKLLLEQLYQTEVFHGGQIIATRKE